MLALKHPGRIRASPDRSPGQPRCSRPGTCLRSAAKTREEATMQPRATRRATTAGQCRLGEAGSAAGASVTRWHAGNRVTAAGRCGSTIATRPAVFVAGAALVVLLASCTVTPGSQGPAAGPTPPARATALSPAPALPAPAGRAPTIRIVGNHFADGHGTEIRLLGVNFAG